MNNAFETHDKFHADLRSMIQSKDSTDSTLVVVRTELAKPVKNTGVKGKMVKGKFITFLELDEQRRQAKIEASQLLSDNRTFDVEGLKADKSNGNFGGVFRSFSEREFYNKLNGDEFGASFVKMIAENKVKVNAPMATEAELKSYAKTGNFGSFSILR